MLLFAVSGVSPAIADNPGPITDTTLWIHNQNNTNNCILMSGGGGSIWTCSSFADQEWLTWWFSGFTGNMRLMYNMNSGKCMAVPSKTNNARVGEATCDPNDFKQQWVWEVISIPNFPNSWLIWNVWSGMCLLAQNGSTNAPLTQWGCDHNNPYPDALWEITRSP